MNMSRFTSHDGREVQLYIWDEVTAPRGVVKIAHGMAEHSMRYDDFARFLNEHGYIVVANDHRGHGLTAEANSLGYEEGDMFGNNVHDQLCILENLRKKYNLPLYLMGHSYGSFVVQSAMEQHPDADGFILCGSNYIKGLSFTACGVVARSNCRHKGGRYPAALIERLSFGTYGKRFSESKNAWLNRDAQEVAKYDSDSYCGFTCSANFYRSFMAGIGPLYKKEAYSEIDTTKPLLIIAGSDDPVGNYGKGVRKLAKFYTERVGVSDVTLHLYDGARHEILNETNKEQVYDDILLWLDAYTAPVDQTRNGRKRR